MTTTPPPITTSPSNAPIDPTNSAAGTKPPEGTPASAEEVFWVALGMTIVVIIACAVIKSNWPGWRVDEGHESEFAVLAVSPSSFATNVDIAVTVHGRGFVAATNVALDGNPADAVQFVSSRLLQARFKGVAKPGLLRLVVTWPSGQNARLAGAVLIHDEDLKPADPKPESIAPAAGSVSGGEPVVVRGSGLGRVTSVSFGGVAAQDFWQLGDSALAVVTPPHAAGVVDVFVGGVPLAGAFTFNGTTCLLLLVFAAGALGGALHALRSLVAHVGARTLKRRWLLQYWLQPVASGGLALVFYFVVVAGFYTNGTTASPAWMVGLATVVGLFSDQAFERLILIAAGLFAEKPKRPNPLPSPPDKG